MFIIVKNFELFVLIFAV